MPGHVAPFIRFPDGAMIPLMIAQALQTLFRFREVTNPKRPLRNTLDNELLREFLRSGDLVATTFYDPVRFNEYGQNVGRDAATMQVRGGVARMVRPVVFQADVDAFHYPPRRRSLIALRMPTSASTRTRTACSAPPPRATPPRYGNASLAASSFL